MTEKDKISPEELEEVSGGATAAFFNTTIGEQSEKEEKDKNTKPLAKVTHPSLATLKRLLELRKGGTKL